MSTAAIAIIVSAISAVFTATNMLVSYATYRRARPRLSVTVESSEWIHGPSATFEEDSAWRSVDFKVRLVNMSPTEMKLSESPVVQFRSSKWARPIPAQGHLEFIKGEKSVELAPFGATQWQLSAHHSIITSMRDNGMRQMRFSLLLPDGRRINGKWIPCNISPDPEPDSFVYYLLHGDDPEHRQLSFDDVNE
jgi:hypothetical protein